jgi:DHA1 family multidrug resistance protein-like MFS transporter
MVLRHATSTQVGLSWTLFALPFALLSVPAGRLAGRFDRRALTLVALGSSAAFCALYPFLHSVAVLVVCCTFEAIGAVIGTPAAVLVLTAAIPANAQGEAQGSVETARTAATAVAAAASGALFGIDPLVPFVASAGIVLVACVAVGVAWRSLPGHDDLGAELEAPVASTVLP